MKKRYRTIYIFLLLLIIFTILFGLFLKDIFESGQDASDTDMAESRIEEEVSDRTKEDSIGTDVNVEEENSEINDTKTTNQVNLDDFVGDYIDDTEEREVHIVKDGNSYSAELVFSRLTTISDGIVTTTADGVIIDATDAAGEPISFSLKRIDDDSYILRVEQTTWAYFDVGDTFDNIKKR